MKNFKLFLTLFLITILAMPAWGADESVIFSDVYSADDNPTTYNGTDFSVTFNKGTNSNEPVYKTTGAAVRIYGGGYFIVSSTTKTITKIELTFGSGDGTNAITTDVDTYNSSNTTWTGSATSVKFSIGGTSGHRRLAKIAVTFSGGATEKVATPTFTPAAGSYSSAQSVTISCSTSGATIHYTTDGTTPTASSPTYSSAITVSSTKTIKAIAVKSGMTNSDVASATYTITASCSADITLSFKGGSQTKPWTSCTLPTVIDDEDKCEGWDFAGWSETEITSTTTAPTLITEKNTDGTVYAVYTQGGSGTTTTKKSTFTDKDAGVGTGEPEWTSTGATGYDGTYDRGIAWNKAAGTLTNTSLSANTITKIVVTASSNASSGKQSTMSITVGGSVFGVAQTIAQDNHIEYTYSGSKSGNIVISTTATTDKSCWIESVEVSYSSGGGSGATYTTYCDLISSSELEIVEWNPDYINIMVPDPENASVVIEDKNEHKTTAVHANDIFFSKYFEAAFNVKLIAIFNGTGHDVDVSDLRIHMPYSTDKNRYVNLDTCLANPNHHGGSPVLKDGEEIIFYSWQPTASSKSGSVNCYRDNDILDDVRAKGTDMSNWIALPYSYSVDEGQHAICFGGNTPILLERNVGGNWTPIDIIGAATSDLKTYNGSDVKTPDWGDANGWTCALAKSIKDTTQYLTGGISTNRCLLVRKASVRDGLNAVANNIATTGNPDPTFATLCTEWYGYHVDYSSSKTNCYETDNENSADGFAYVGSYDYTSTYQQYEHVATVTDFDVSNLNPDGSYRVDIPQLDTLACTKLKIILSGTTPATNFYDVPIMVEAGGKMTTDEIFHNYNKTEEICKTCDVVILTGGSLTKAADEATNDVPEVRNVTVYPRGQLVVPSGTNYKVNSVRFRIEDEDVPSAKLTGNITSTLDSVYVTRRINNSRYYFFSLPYACNVSDIRWSNGEPATHGTDFAIREYNSQKRANNGWCSGASSNWDIVANDAVLQPMKGYVVAVATDYKSELVFPMKVDNTNLTVDEENKNNTVDIHTYTSSKTKNNHNWNFIAHPYISQLTPGVDADITAGKLTNTTGKQDGWYYDDPTNEYLTFFNPDSKDYDQKILSGAPLDPFLAFFVQAKQEGSYEFAKTNRILSAPARRFAAKSEYTDESIFVGVTLSGNGGKDQTNLRIRPDFNEEYQLGYDLAKFSTTSETRPIIYMRNGIYDLAFRALNDNNAAMSQPMGVYCKTAGTYTFALSNDYSRENIEAVYLYDAETQQTINLMNDTYEFTTTGNLNTGERFYLSAVVRRPAPQVTTDNELVNEELPLTRKIILNGHVFIQHGGKLFDITGKEMLNH